MLRTIIVVVAVIVAAGLGIAFIFNRPSTADSSAQASPSPIMPIASPVISPTTIPEVESSSNQLTGITWVWQNTKMNDGTVIVPAKKDAFSLVFTSEKTVSGTTDCNSFNGTYQTGENNSLTFGPLASTKMFCEGSQETEFLSRLQNVAQYMYLPTGDLVLLIKFDSGSMTFIKK
jgi:heat shock protein HslJ